MPPVCLDTPICLDTPTFVWMPPVHTQHKESMLCQTKGCPYAPINLDDPICLDGLFMFGWPHMLGHHPYVWMPSVCWDTPIFLDTSLYVWMSPYVWIPTVCLDTPICLDAPTIYLDAPYVWIAPCMFGCQPVCLDAPMFGHCHMFGHPPVGFDVTICLDAPPVCLDAPIWLDNPLYVWMPPICLDTPCKFGHPYIWMPPCMFRRCLDACCTYTTKRKHALSN